MSKTASRIFESLKKSQFKHALYLLRTNHNNNKLTPEEYDYLHILFLRLLVRHCQQGFIPSIDFCNEISQLPLFIGFNDKGIRKVDINNRKEVFKL